MDSESTFVVLDEYGRAMACGTDQDELRAYAIDRVGVHPPRAMIEILWTEPGYVRNRVNPPKPKRPGRG